MFDTVLIANRGEIACRITRTLREHGIRSAVVFTDPDASAKHVREADTAVRVPDYLDTGAVVAAAVRVGADAVHPGYGFLAENAEFARAVVAAGLVFVGPPARAIELMGDKIRAKRTVAAYGVPVVPGSAGTGLSDTELAAEARKIGLPVLLKPSAGGGGKGMHLVRDEDALADAIAAARREAAGAFGDDTLLVERWIDRPRHIEVQILADTHGNVVHLGERECSLQRRHQKIVEEAPSVLLTPERRAAMGAAAVEAARSCGYVGAGTVEFIVPGDRPDEYFFMEMNTRLQVEHPVTEMVTGLDLVWCQLTAAAGHELGVRQDEIRLDGHAVEARVYAEDPARGFLPGGGRVVLLREPAGHGHGTDHGNGSDQGSGGGGRVRVDSGLVEGGEVAAAYDPMLAKVVAWGRDRDEALRTLRAALARTTVLGVRTNLAFLDRLLAHDDVVAGRLDTGLVEAALPDLTAHTTPPAVAITAALLAHADREPKPDADGWTDPFAVPSGWRLGAHAPTTYRLRIDGADPVDVRIHGHGPHTEAACGDAEMAPARLLPADDNSVLLDHDGLTETYRHAAAGDGSRWIARGTHTWRVVAFDPIDAGPGAAGTAGDGTLLAPMPGTVTLVKAAAGDRVTEGQAVVVVEAMKMEHTVTAPVTGTLAELRVDVGARVALDEVLAVVHPDASGGTGTPDDGETAAGAERADPAERQRNKNCEDKS